MQKHPKGFFVRHFGLRGVAIFEAVKGMFAIGFVVWVFSQMHKGTTEVTQEVLEVLRRLLHINPERHFYQRFLHGASRVTPQTVRIIITILILYAAIRFVEAAGLWLEKEWAEWFALIAGSLYIPFEIFELARHPTGFKWLILGSNALVVVYLAWLLRDSYRRRHAIGEAAD
jgi:uncharacterized membrane protein (DUF2068 family)